jgi:hypothetical protein
MKYESPTLMTVGSLRELTLGEGVRGDADNFTFVSDWGYEISVDYGTS